MTENKINGHNHGELQPPPLPPTRTPNVPGLKVLVCGLEIPQPLLDEWNASSEKKRLEVLQDVAWAVNMRRFNREHGHLHDDDETDAPAEPWGGLDQVHAAMRSAVAEFLERMRVQNQKARRLTKEQYEAEEAARNGGKS